MWCNIEQYCTAGPVDCIQYVLSTRVLMRVRWDSLLLFIRKDPGTLYVDSWARMKNEASRNWKQNSKVTLSGEKRPRFIFQTYPTLRLALARLELRIVDVLYLLLIRWYNKFIHSIQGDILYLFLVQLSQSHLITSYGSTVHSWVSRCSNVQSQQTTSETVP